MTGEICGCRRGYKSWHDGLCGHCRTRKDKEKLAKYFREIDALQPAVQIMGMHTLRARYFGK